MELLQTAVCDDDIFLADELFGLAEQQLFAVEVFLEVIVAQLLVYLEIVGVAFAGVLETLPHRCLVGCGYVADGVELVLQLAVSLESAVDIVGVFGQSDNLVDYFILADEVCGSYGFLLGGVCGLALADGVEQRKNLGACRVVIFNKSIRLVAILDPGSALAVGLVFANGVVMLAESAQLVARNIGGCSFRHLTHYGQQRVFGKFGY